MDIFVEFKIFNNNTKRTIHKAINNNFIAQF